uniref:TPR_REGION domain-containing protein n=1 Tax=Macrostomum lignano TaxID=282301 RepID=A0A1I8J8K8_9PLAT
MDFRMGGGTASNSSKWDWKTIALVSVPVAGLGLGVAYYYFYHRRSQNAEKGKKKKSVEESTGQSSQEASPPPSQQQQQQQPATPLEAALQVKERGNKYYRGGRYDKAIECYSEAIDLCPPDQSDTLSTFYQNRAAALESLGKWDDVERDCTSALEHSPRYTKALARRAKVLKSRGRQLAKESASRIVPSLPSKAFLRSFFMSFSEDPVQREPIGSDPFSAALQALSDGKFDQLIGLCEEALKAPVHSNGSAQTPSPTASAEASQAAGESGDEPQPQEQQQEQQAAEKQSYLTPYRRDLCRLLLATLQLLSGQPLSAEPTLKSLANSNDVDRSVRANALIKLASLAMQAAMPGQTDVLTDSVLGHFDRALQLCPDHPDAHHHRGQMLLLTDRLDEALVHLTKACEGAPANPIPAVQRAYASHRTGSGANALDQLRRLTEKHRRCGEAHSLYAQALLETQQFDEAEKAFKRVTELEPDSGTAYVHQGLLRLQAHNDTEGGVALIQRALEVEPRCEFALETLATIEVQRGNLDAAIGLFDRAIALTKTEAELAHLWALREAADVQLQLARDMGLRMPSLAAGMHQAF